LVFAAWDNITTERQDEFIKQLSAIRKPDEATLAYMKTTLEGIAGRPGETNFNWAARQAYIAIGTALIAAANVQVDATPMEGFNPQAVDDILGLKEKGLRSVALVALGYRDTINDHSLNAPKMRREKEKLFISLN
jgi:nitroreductase